jgi:hypothetical protein
VSSRPDPMTTLTTDRISTELLQDTLLTMEQVTTSVTVLVLNASAHPEQSPRVRMLLDDLLTDIQECEGDLGSYAPLDA